MHRISARFDDQYEIVAGVFSRSAKLSISFGKSLGITKDRCYSNYTEMANKEAKREDGIDVVAIMTPPSSHQIIAEKFIDKNEAEHASSSPANQMETSILAAIDQQMAANMAKDSKQSSKQSDHENSAHDSENQQNENTEI